MIDKKPNNKEIVKLRFEYLKKSEDYKKVCNYYADHNKSRYDDFPNHLKLTFVYWGDIHNVSFDDWWKSNKERLNSPYMSSQIIRNKEDDTFKYGSIFDENKEYFISLFKGFWSQFKKETNREPTYDDIDYLFERVFFYPPIFFCFFDANGIANYDDLAKEFIKKVREKKTNKGVKHLWHTMKKLRFDELKKYLKAYDYKKKGLTYRQIAKRLKMDKGKDYASINSQISKLIKKAKKIIKNVEKGNFPGNTKK